MNDNKEQAQNDKRVIKKYPNRRLYDTSESKYVTLSDVRELVLSGISFCVIDKKSGEDITRSILLQIIIEQEEEGEPMFSTDVLEQMIGFYGNSAQTMAGDLIQNSLKLFQQQQEKMQSQFSDAMQHNPMAAAFTEATRRNMELWQEMQASFFSGVTGATRRNPDDDT